MTFKELSDFIKEYSQKLENKFGKYNDNEKLILSSAVKLTEEIGELCAEVMFFNSRQRQEKLNNHAAENLPAEFADVIWAVFMLAKDMDVDLDKAVKMKIKKIKARY
ncbi:MAG TPA: MazG nucleotide pyrophosphohydrolase domain-containing protein [bacterium]|nr:MazG nucleotide pyrophosphohydrolase domain-containing protein [bacterium]HNS34196.1 MazG nucleotide pyrophosphohydrolase domain-containing protein [bacterium]